VDLYSALSWTHF